MDSKDFTLASCLINTTLRTAKVYYNLKKRKIFCEH